MPAPQAEKTTLHNLPLAGSAGKQEHFSEIIEVHSDSDLEQGRGAQRLEQCLGCNFVVVSPFQYLLQGSRQIGGRGRVTELFQDPGISVRVHGCVSALESLPDK